MRPLRAAFCNPRAVYTPPYPPPRITTRGGLEQSGLFFEAGSVAKANDNASKMNIWLSKRVVQHSSYIIWKSFR